MQVQAWSQWRMHSAKTRDKISMASSAAPWTGRADTKCHGLARTERVTDLLDVAWAHRRLENQHASVEELKKGFWCNPTQGVQRRPWGVRPATLTTVAELYSYQYDVALSGHAGLRVMGFPPGAGSTSSLSESDYRHLAGEMFSIPIATCILFSLYQNPHATWWPRG